MIAAGKTLLIIEETHIFMAKSKKGLCKHVDMFTSLHSIIFAKSDQLNLLVS